MAHLLLRLCELVFRIISPSSPRGSVNKGISLSQEKPVKSEKPFIIEQPEVKRSDTCIMVFMYHHYQHCVTSKETSIASKSLELFTLFPYLPPELRVKIWEAVAEEPLTVELTCTPVATHISRGQWISHSKPPTMFHVNAESRAVALRKYSVLTFSPGQIGVPPSKLYINFASDTLWLCADLASEWARNLLERNEQLKEHLRSLVVSEQLWKKLNPKNLIPLPMPIMAKWQRANSVAGGLKALEDVQFHC